MSGLIFSKLNLRICFNNEIASSTCVAEISILHFEQVFCILLELEVVYLMKLFSGF